MNKKHKEGICNKQKAVDKQNNDGTFDFAECMQLICKMLEKQEKLIAHRHNMVSLLIVLVSSAVLPTVIFLAWLVHPKL